MSGSDPQSPDPRPASRCPERAAFRRRAFLVLALIALAVLALDQGTKHWAQQRLRLVRRTHQRRRQLSLLQLRAHPGRRGDF